MENVLFALLMAILLAGYYIGQRLLREYVTCVEAGPTELTNALDLQKRSHIAPRITLVENGITISTKGMLRVVVHGNCLKERGIHEGSQLFVQKIPKDANISEILKTGDIIILHHPNTNTDVIREFAGFTSKGDLLSCYYETNGTKHLSSIHSPVQNLIGVAKYLF